MIWIGARHCVVVGSGEGRRKYSQDVNTFLEYSFPGSVVCCGLGDGEVTGIRLVVTESKVETRSCFASMWRGVELRWTRYRWRILERGRRKRLKQYSAQGKCCKGYS
jgi:hypothetical protein